MCPISSTRNRWIVVARAALFRVLFAVLAENHPSGRIRIISARKASRAQRRRYEEA
jgi:uncharacterized DUF497 family protein